MARRHRLRDGLLIALAVTIVGAGTAAARATTAAYASAKVVLIVGPAGSATSYYERLADETAAAAAAFTRTVVKVYSPDATWAAVKAALQGASIVVYLGHGNGWPSIYRDALYPPTQNGFGLNPHAGAADAHQYFGESQIGSQVHLARDAVVVLSHLCYASGNTEPDLAEGTLDQAQQRVDNYAAGFFRAGAGAVIADAYLSPTYYVTSVLRGRSTVDAIWRSAPNRNDHFLRFDSRRTKGAIAEMDPDGVDAGYHRSIVLKRSLGSAQVLDGATGRPGDVTAIVEPTLIGRGLNFGAPDLTSPPTAGTTTTLVLPLTKNAAAALPKKVMVGTRWNVLEPSAAGGIGSSSDGPGTIPDGGSAGAGGSRPPSDDPVTTSGNDAAGADLVMPEESGELVAPVRAKLLAGGGISVPVRLPANPGLYRLVATIHGADGQAFDAATQALVPALVVRVIGDDMAVFAVAPTASATAGGPLSLEVRVTNVGRSTWGHTAAGQAFRKPGIELISRATLVARWVDLGGGSPPGSSSSAPVATSNLPAGLAPGEAADVDLEMSTPIAAGDYLLVLDVVDPRIGSLAATGAPPGIVRVTVVP
jgi:hypothetical protein